MHQITASLALFALVSPLAAQSQSIALTHGSDQHFDVPFSPLLEPPTGITVEAWVTYDDTGIPVAVNPRFPTICRQGVGHGLESWLFRVEAGSVGQTDLRFKVVTTGGVGRSCLWRFAQGELQSWTHVAATYDGRNIRIYKNGTQVINCGFGTPFEIRGGGGLFRVGNGDTFRPGHETWNGQIDELRVWPFPRTQPEIRSTMNDQLDSVAGKAVTFNLDGDYVDSSQGLTGTATGGIAFSTNVPSLNPVSVLSSTYGQGTSFCARTLDSGVSTVPTPGNADFSIVCTKVSPSSLFGVLVASDGVSAPPGVAMFGVSVFIDPNRILSADILIPATDALGTARRRVPIPNTPAAAGATLQFQYGFADALCGPAGFTSSDAIQVVVQ